MLPTDLTADLLRFARHHDHTAFERVLAGASAPAYQHARRFLGNSADADDAVQEALLQLTRSAHRFDGTIPFAAWMGRLTYLACLRVRRSHRHYLRQRAMPSDPEVTAPDHDLAEAMQAAIQHLPERYRAPIALHHLAGLPYEQAAAALGLTSSALGVRLLRGRERLRRYLHRAGFEVPAATLAGILAANPLFPVPPAIAQHGSHLSAQVAHQLSRHLPYRAGLPKTTVPHSLISHGAHVMATYPLTAITLVGCLCLAAVMTPIVIHAEESSTPASAPMTVTSSTPSHAAAPSADPASSETMPLSLETVAGWQRDDGSWDEATILDQLGVSAERERLSNPLQATALACRCLLAGAHEQPVRTSFPEPISRAMRWIASQQRRDGSFGGSLGDTARVVLAIDAAALESKDPLQIAMAQRGVNYLLSQRSGMDGTVHWGVERSGAMIDIRDATQCILAVNRARDLSVATLDDLKGARTQLVATWEAANPTFSSMDAQSESTYPLQADAFSLAANGGRGLSDALALGSILGDMRLPDPALPPVMMASLRQGLGDLDRLDPAELYLAVLSASAAQDAESQAFLQQLLAYLHRELTASGPLAHWWDGKRIPSTSRLTAALLVVLALRVGDHR